MALLLEGGGHVRLEGAAGDVMLEGTSGTPVVPTQTDEIRRLIGRLETSSTA